MPIPVILKTTAPAVCQHLYAFELSPAHIILRSIINLFSILKLLQNLSNFPNVRATVEGTSTTCRCEQRIEEEILT